MESTCSFATVVVVAVVENQVEPPESRKEVEVEEA